MDIDVNALGNPEALSLLLPGSTLVQVDLCQVRYFRFSIHTKKRQCCEIVIRKEQKAEYKLIEGVAGKPDDPRLKISRFLKGSKRKQNPSMQFVDLSTHGL